MEKMSSIIRREFKKDDDIRDAGLTAPDDVIRYKDIAYGKDSAMQVLDVYRPKDTEGNLSASDRQRTWWRLGIW